MLLDLYGKHVCDNKVIPIWNYVEHNAESHSNQVFLELTYYLIF